MYVYVAVLIVGLCAGFGGAWQTQSWRFAAADRARLQAQATERFRKEERAYTAAAGHEEFKAKTEIEYVTRTREVVKILERPVYRNVCIDADGLRLLNDEIAGRAPAGQPAPAVPGPAAAR